MKTIKQAALEYSDKPAFIAKDIKIEAQAGFQAGVEFAQQWISAKERVPKNTPLLMKDNNECMHVGFYAECIFFDSEFNHLKNIKVWRLIELK